VILSFGYLAIHQKVFFPKIRIPNWESAGCIIYKVSTFRQPSKFFLGVTRLFSFPAGTSHSPFFYRIAGYNTHFLLKFFS